jgi:aspartyl-tRNA(Asn)/glutamyl-tRNA(Gln) amidotransferase subunit B
MRGKEEAADYRYFPEPDLLRAVISDEMLAKYSQIPELPDAKRDRFVKEFGINEYNAGVITSSVEMAHFFEEMLSTEGVSAKTATSLLTVELQGRLKGELNITNSPVNAAKLGLLALRIDDKTISGKAAKEVLDYLMENDKDVDGAIETLGLKQVSDTGAIEAICDAIIAENPEKVAEYKGGKEKLFGFFVGQTMKASQGSADPQTVNEILKAKLG